MQQYQDGVRVRVGASADAGGGATGGAAAAGGGASAESAMDVDLTSQGIPLSSIISPVPITASKSGRPSNKRHRAALEGAVSKKIAVMVPRSGGERPQAAAAQLPPSPSPDPRVVEEIAANRPQNLNQRASVSSKVEERRSACGRLIKNPKRESESS